MDSLKSLIKDWIFFQCSSPHLHSSLRRLQPTTLMPTVALPSATQTLPSPSPFYSLAALFANDVIYYCWFMVSITSADKDRTRTQLSSFRPVPPGAMNSNACSTNTHTHTPPPPPLCRHTNAGKKGNSRKFVQFSRRSELWHRKVACGGGVDGWWWCRDECPRKPGRIQGYWSFVGFNNSSCFRD